MNKALIIVAVLLAGCGGSTDNGSSDQLSSVGELAKKSYDDIKAAVDAGNGADQDGACTFLAGMLRDDVVSEADKQLLTDSRKLCYGEVHKAMYLKTVADVEARPAEEQLPPFMECVPAQTALDNGATEVDVPGLTEAKARARELCAKAWEE